MSLLKAIRAQLGLSASAAQNFTLDASAADGTMKLARGNAGATTQDIITVAGDGKVDFPAGLAAFLGTNQALSNPGYQKLPGGLIIQWGFAYPNASGNLQGTFPVVVPNGQLAAFCTPQGEANPSVAVGCFSLTKTNYDFRVRAAGGAAITTVPLYWVVIGY
jgi:hypothetical protein